MKAICILTDGQDVSLRKEMDVFEFIRANQEAKEQTDGAWWWTLDKSQPLLPFEVSLADSQGNPRGFHEELAPSKEWLRATYGEHYAHVHVCSLYQSEEPANT